MAKFLYPDFERNCKYFVELKFDFPEVYADRQAELKEKFDSGQRFSLQKVYRHVCPVCEDIFYSTVSNQIYDTSRCKETAKRQRNKKKNSLVCVCASCGSYFIPTRHDAKFCSGKCRQRAYRYRKQPTATNGGAIIRNT